MANHEAPCPHCGEDQRLHGSAPCCEKTRQDRIRRATRKHHGLHQWESSIPTDYARVLTGASEAGDLVWNFDDKRFQPVDSINEYVDLYICLIRPAQPSPPHAAQTKTKTSRLSSEQSEDDNRTQFIARLISAGWKVKEAEVEWENIQNDEEGQL